MFAKLKRAFSNANLPPNVGDGLFRWGVSRMLSQHCLSNGATVIEGQLLDFPFKAGCAPASRPYIVGVELMARSELGLPADVNVVVMHRALKRALEKAAAMVYSQAVDSVQTMAAPLPEELVWLSTYRDAGWPGPAPDFWARYCVLTYNLEAARQWLDAAAIESLCAGPAALRPVTPYLMALTRGKLYMRLQLEAADDGLVSHHVLDTFEQLCARAIGLFGR